MKNLIPAFFLCFLSNACLASDWTPVFKQWETHGTHSDIVFKIDDVYSLKNDFHVDGTDYRIVNLTGWNIESQEAYLNDDKINVILNLNQTFSAEDYYEVPQPYRSDIVLGMAKVNFVSSIADVGIYELFTYLQNATLYGLPINYIHSLNAQNSDEAYKEVVFHNMTNAQYRQLKKIKFAKNMNGCPDYYQAYITKKDSGEVALIMPGGC